MMVTTTADLVPADVAVGESRSGAGQLADGAGFAAGRRLRRAAGSRRSAATTTRSRRRTPQSGWVYIVANNFDRSGPVVLYRATPETFTDRGELAGLVGGAAAGDKPPTPLWPDRVGEMSIRQIDGKTVLSYFNATHRQHGGAGRRRSDGPGHRAGDDGRRRRGLAGSGRTPAGRRRTTGWRSPTAATSRRVRRSTRCGCSSASGTPRRAAGRRTGSSSSR